MIPTDHISSVWPEVSVLFKPAVDRCRGRFNIDDVLDDLMKQKTSLWIAATDIEILAAVSVSVVDYPRRRFARYEVVGAKPHTMFSDWGDAMREIIEHYAKNAMNCDGIEGGGRLGWARVCLTSGYKSSGVFVEKDI